MAKGTDRSHASSPLAHGKLVVAGGALRRKAFHHSELGERARD
jgi:alkylated DNA repair dioxygenase AlkB